MSGNLLDLVGKTPMITLPTGVGSPHVRLLGKHEGQNPGGSVKDRPARSMILGAEARGEASGRASASSSPPAATRGLRSP